MSKKISNRYRITDGGSVVLSDSIYEASDIKTAVMKRIEKLEQLISSNATLELDYDSEENKWNAMRYVPEDGCAYPLEDNTGRPITAFRNINRSIIEKASYDADIYIVS